VLATVVIASAGILAGALAMTQARRLERFERWKRFLQQPFWGKLHKVYVALTSYSFGAIARSTLVSLPFTATLIATQYVLSIALGVSVEARYFILFTPLIALTQVLPISFNGLGVREGAFGVLFGSVGVAGSDAVAISLLYYVTRVLTGLFGGILYVIGNLYHPSSHRRTNP
jgi:hypothetical protein